MTTKKISELTELIALSDADAVPVVHTGVTKRISGANLKSYMLTGTVTALNFAATSNGAGTSFKVGDDAWIGDINVGNSIGVRGIQDATQGYIVFGNANSTSYIGRSGTGPITVTGAFAATGNVTAQNINTTGNIIPLTDNVYTLGSTLNRWKSAYIGPGSIYIQDTANAALNAELTVTNGVLLVNGANQLQVGQLKFVNNTIESTTGAIDIQIGNVNSSANLVLNRNVVLAAGKTFGLVDTVLGTPATMSVTNGVLLVNGANQLQVGQLKFVNNTIESTQSNIDIQIGYQTDTANLILERETKITQPLIVGNIDPDGNTINVNGTLYDSQLTISDYGGDRVGQLMLHRHSTTVQPILVASLSNSDDGSHVDIGYGQPIFQIAATAIAGDDYKEFGGIVFKSDDLDGITISNSSSPGRIDFNVTPDGQVGTNTAFAIRSDCAVEFSNGLILNPSQIPSTSKGNPGDRSGMFAVDNNNIYYCVENYSNGNVNIWKKTALTGGTW